jgi:hypothetical protein
MPMHEGRKGRLVTAAEVVLQQLPVGQPRTVPQQQRPAEVQHDLARLAARHALSFTVAPIALYAYYYPQAAV